MGERDGDGTLDESLLQTLLRETTLAVAATDASGNLSMMSPALQAMLQVPFTSVSEQDLPEHFRTYDESGSRLLRPDEVPVARARRGESVRDEIIVVNRADGVMLHLRCNGAPLRRADGTIRGGIILVADVTAERTALAEQEALRDRLIETVSHELRTPLASLLGHAELLEDLALDLPPQARRSLEALVAAGRRLHDVVDTVSELLDLEDASRLDRTEADVAALVRRTVGESEARAAALGITLVPELPESIDAVVCQARLRRAVASLLENALTYAPRGSAVRVRAYTDDAAVRIDVSDAGPGIPARDRDRLVQPFERGVDARPVSSRGLGLAVAHTVAVAHGGTLTLEDAEPHGLHASLCLPLAEPAPCLNADDRRHP
ncbi:PAS domain-containing sensor histidine kinase [Nocardioides pacificus]